MIQNFSDFLLDAPIFSLEKISLIIVVGILVGFINTIAGMATALSYALFMAMGLPINVANGTTRLGITLQFATTSLIFRKKGYLDIPTASKVGVPIAIGSIIGAIGAAVLDVKIMEWTMAIILPIMSIFLFIDKNKILRKARLDDSQVVKISIFKFAIFTIIGIYGGYTHSGIGLLIIFGSFLLLGQDLIRSNAIKQFVVLIYTPLALIIFVIYDQINWEISIIYAIGNIIGGILGSRYAIKWGEKFIKISILIIVIIMSTFLVYKQL